MDWTTFTPKSRPFVTEISSWYGLRVVIMPNYYADSEIIKANVLIGDNKQALLCDFGLAHAMDSRSSGLTTSNFEHKLTARYASPEILMGKQPRSVQSDSWAYGCIVMEVSPLPWSDRSWFLPLMKMCEGVDRS